MVREIMAHEGKIAPADCKAASAVSTGMGVIIDRATKSFDLPSAATAADIYVVHKDRTPVGVWAGVDNLSDYFEQFNSVAQNEYAPLWKYEAADVFAVDQYDASLADGDKGKLMAVGTDGKWTVAGSGATSVYKFVDWFMDNGHKLAKIEVLDTAVANS